MDSPLRRVGMGGDNDDGGDGGSVALESVVFGRFLDSLGKLAAFIHQSFCS